MVFDRVMPELCQPERFLVKLKLGFLLRAENK
jgi:hypothetical protein